MEYHIKEIALPQDKDAQLASEFAKYTIVPAKSKGPKTLPSLSKINIFVGENNSGKSKFLRHIAATGILQYVPTFEAPMGWTWEMVAGVCSSFLENSKLAMERLDVLSVEPLTRQFRRFGSFDIVQEGTTSLFDLGELVVRVLQPNPIQALAPGRIATHLEDNLARALQDSARTWMDNMANIKNYTSLGQVKFTKMYIPTLRGLRVMTTEHDDQGRIKDVYRSRTITDYFSNGPTPEIFTGQTLYDDVQRLLLGNLTDRKKIRQFEQFLSRHFFEGREIALIPKLEQPVLHIKIGSEQERSIQYLGDGIQSIIVLTFPLFSNSDKDLLVFCEEPEMYMHPSLQRVLLSVFNEFPRNQYFVTTHSNHFLDLTLDFKSVSVYTFQKQLEGADGDERDARFTIENIANENRRGLELLGVRNSSVFLSNCTIWVEGITDRRYYQRFLELYEDHHKLKRFKEDLHYSFVEYGGSCITHWSVLDEERGIDVDRLCGRLFLIADGDTATGWKEERHQKLAARLEDRYCRLECKEVENLLPPAVMKRVLAAYGETEIQEFAQKDYYTKSLGKFLEETALNGKKKRKGSYADDGTISEKVGFCAKALDAMKTFDDVSPEAQKIAERLYNFIAAHN